MQRRSGAAITMSVCHGDSVQKRLSIKYDVHGSQFFNRKFIGSLLEV